jgi:hypothetical protein
VAPQPGLPAYLTCARRPSPSTRSTTRCRPCGRCSAADEALLGVAFVQHRGVNLLERQLLRIARGRLVTTTAFGSSTAEGLTAVQDAGLDVRVLNPRHGTFHPKLYWRDAGTSSSPWSARRT